MEVAYISLIIAPPYSEKNYKQLTLTAIYYTDFLATDPDLYLALVPHLVSTTYEDKAITDVL